MCHFLKEEGTTAHWDSKLQAPYAYKDDQWVAYDDTRSMRIKVYKLYIQSELTYAK